MGRALVVYESMFGNTEAVAHALAQGLGLRMLVEVVPVTQAPAKVDCGVELLVVGGPTHAFGLSRASTRRSAREQGASPVGGLDAELDRARTWGVEMAMHRPGRTSVATR